MARNLEHLDFHNAAFEVPEFPEIAVLRDLMVAHPGGSLETSVKLSQGRVEPCRYVYYLSRYQRDGVTQAANYRAAREFIETIGRVAGGSTNSDLFHQLESIGLDFARVGLVLVGLDRREEPGSTRAKLWLVASDYQELADHIATMSKDGAVTIGLNSGPTWLFGFDFFVDGTTDVKLYPRATMKDVHESGGQHPLVRGAPPKLFELLDCCDLLYGQVTGRKKAGRIYHLRALRWAASTLVERIGDARLAAIDSIYERQPIRSRYYAVREDEIASGAYSEMNAYYQELMAEPSPG